VDETIRVPLSGMKLVKDCRSFTPKHVKKKSDIAAAPLLVIQYVYWKGPEPADEVTPRTASKDPMGPVASMLDPVSMTGANQCVVVPPAYALDASVHISIANAHASSVFKITFRRVLLVITGFPNSAKRFSILRLT